MTLNKYKKNIFSQYGEDGIIEEIMKRLKIDSGACVEFGAWDGFFLSNTANLWSKNENWRGILIESDKKRADMLKKIGDEKRCLAIHGHVSIKGSDSIENILKINKVDFSSIKMLSVDIDGNEYHIIKNILELRPPIIISEYNPTIPPEIHLVSAPDSSFGCSVKSLTELMESKNYKLVAVTKSNCIYVDKKYESAFADIDTKYENIVDRSELINIITGYNGDYVLSNHPGFGIGLPKQRKMIESGDVVFVDYTQNRVRWNRFKDSIKKIIDAVLGFDNIMRVRNIISYLAWFINGMKIPPHPFYKVRVLNKLRKKYGLALFVETGTAGADTIIKLSNKFNRLYTIELNLTTYNLAKVRTKEIANIKCFQGDSGDVLTKIIPLLDKPTLYWLDAHYSGAGTAMGSLETPIINELKHILSRGKKGDVVVIDDARCFDGTHDYPTIKMLEEFISKYNYLDLDIKRDMIIIKQK
jgi:hypothetical protein